MRHLYIKTIEQDNKIKKSIQRFFAVANDFLIIQSGIDLIKQIVSGLLDQSSIICPVIGSPTKELPQTGQLP
jgi:2-hydroxy-3-keto-5-methylthiopentenyl-1-phosphate phosphatase